MHQRREDEQKQYEKEQKQKMLDEKEDAEKKE